MGFNFIKKTVKQIIWERFDQLMGGVGDDITPQDVDIDEPAAREKIQQMMKQKGIDQNGNY